MKLAIMQPYFLPYIGYFQLINAVDKFIIYDDVTFIKQGWINRNSILVNNKPSLFTVPLVGASSNKMIYELSTEDLSFWRKRFFKTIEQNYKRAPFFEASYGVLNNVIDSEPQNITKLCVKSLQGIMKYLNVGTPIVETSRVYNNQALKAQERVLDICLNENAHHYINPIGGLELYAKEDFLKKNVHLHFIKSKPIIYPQYKETFVPWLSIIDVMMFNSPEEIAIMLDQYELL